MAGFAVDAETIEHVVNALEECIDAIGGVQSLADTAAAEAAVPDTPLPQALRQYAAELRSTINECRLAAAAVQSDVRRSLHRYDAAERVAAGRAAAIAANLRGGVSAGRPIGAPVRAW